MMKGAIAKMALLRKTFYSAPLNLPQLFGAVTSSSTRRCWSCMTVGIIQTSIVLFSSSMSYDTSLTSPRSPISKNKKLLMNHFSSDWGTHMVETVRPSRPSWNASTILSTEMIRLIDLIIAGDVRVRSTLTFVRCTPRIVSSMCVLSAQRLDHGSETLDCGQSASYGNPRTVESYDIHDTWELYASLTSSSPF